MNKSILKQLYDGKFNPQEDVVPSDPEYLPNGNRISEMRTEILDMLDKDGKELMELFESLVLDSSSMCDYAYFAYGFRQGAMLMIELFMGCDMP